MIATGIHKQVAKFLIIMGCQLREDDPHEKVTAQQVEEVKEVMLDSSPTRYVLSSCLYVQNGHVLAL